MKETNKIFCFKQSIKIAISNLWEGGNLAKLATQFFSMPKSNNTSRIAIEKKQKGRENKDI